MDVATLVALIGGIIVILGAIVGIISFFMKLGGRIATQEQKLDKNVADTTAAHDKIRAVVAVQAEHTTEIAVLKTDITYIREGIDDIKAAVTR